MSLGRRGLGRIFRPVYRDRHGVKKTASIWWLAIGVHGKKVRVSTETSDQKQAEKFQLQKAAELGAGNTASLLSARLTLESAEQRLTADYLANGRKNVRHIGLAFRHLGRYFGKVKLSKVDEDGLTAYVAFRLGEDAAPGTVKGELAHLRRAMRLLARKLPRVPEFPTIALRNARKGFFERGDFNAVLARMPEHMRPALEVAFLTGWRFTSEILTREWRHVDFSAGWLRLDPGETKNGDGRMFPLIRPLRVVLEAQRDAVEALGAKLDQVIPWCFPDLDGSRLKSVRREWETARSEAGVASKLLHDFRRTAVRNLERAGVPRAAAMAMVGLRTAHIYYRYAIADEAMILEGAAKLETFLEGPVEPRKVEPISKG